MKILIEKLRLGFKSAWIRATDASWKTRYIVQHEHTELKQFFDYGSAPNFSYRGALQTAERCREHKKTGRIRIVRLKAEVIKTYRES